MSQPILIFDSGLGGLSILKELRQLLPNQHYCYLFDNARLPYGELNDEELIAGCIQLITSVVKSENARVVVIACNTASTLVLSALRDRLSIPVVGVVPAIKPAVSISKQKHIGVLATPATVNRLYTQQLIEKFATNCKVELFGSSELVLYAEAKMAGEQVDPQKLNNILAPISNSSLDTLVLGCTHFPLLANDIANVLGKKITLIDSGAAIAKRVITLLNNKQQKVALPAIKTKAFCTADISEGVKATLINFGFQCITQIPCK